jgi:hypothetical protein
MALALRAEAWNSVGHMVVAKLAYDQLDAKRQLALYNLLKTHPHYKEYLSASRPEGIDNDVEWVVLRSAVWPDWVRERKVEKRSVEITKYNRSEDHYITIPFIDPADAKFFEGKELVNPDVPNIVTALKHRANEMKAKTASPDDRAVAACWLFHLIGDIHQPLHNCSYFSSEKPFVTGDLGGNKFAIKADGRKWKLHVFWDDLLGEDSDYEDDSPEHQGAIYREAVKVAGRLRDVKLDADRIAKNVTFESWSRESHELARTVGYRRPDGTLLKAVEAPFKGAFPAAAEEVGKEYIDAAHATADRQVVMAGKRLADRLTALLGK